MKWLCDKKSIPVAVWLALFHCGALGAMVKVYLISQTQTPIDLSGPPSLIDLRDLEAVSTNRLTRRQ